MKPIIQLKNIHFTYNSESESPVKALNGVTLDVHRGEYLVILGHNGSGKSTLAKHLNGLLIPAEGEVWVKEWSTLKLENMRDIRSTVGMVFQTPDNQIVATIVEEDIAFGPENQGIPHKEIVERVDWSLEQVDMLPYRHRAPHLLSGGQKQRVCIAGVLAMRPQVLVLDESTAMLDPLGRREVLDIAYRLNQEEGTTIIAITHYMEEAVRADRLLVMEEGEIVLEGTPKEVFGQVERLRELQIDVPQITQLALALHEKNGEFPKDILTVDEFVTAVKIHLPKNGARQAGDKFVLHGENASRLSRPYELAEPVIELKNIAYNYMHDTPLEVRAIENVTFDIRQGEILGVIGHTGSGKSTIIQHLNALLRPHEGQVLIFGEDSRDSKVDVREIRRRVGLVFQQPEAQLFEQYVGDDVAYGPRNLKLSREEVRARVRDAMESVGLGFEEYKDRLTFSLSGGQMRRAAVAGVLALQPEVLVMDEPTAGLDPQGRQQLLNHILTLHRKNKTTLVLISHNMEELAAICDRICVISDSTVLMIDSPTAVYTQATKLQEIGLGVPAVTMAMNQLQESGIVAMSEAVLTVSQAAEILREGVR
jgi:energy-coupling factor transport system ATP-binding protein